MDDVKEEIRYKDRDGSVYGGDGCEQSLLDSMKSSRVKMETDQNEGVKQEIDDVNDNHDNGDDDDAIDLSMSRQGFGNSSIREFSAREERNGHQGDDSHAQDSHENHDDIKKEEPDIYECSTCALLFTSMHFLDLHKRECRKFKDVDSGDAIGDSDYAGNDEDGDPEQDITNNKDFVGTVTDASSHEGLSENTGSSGRCDSNTVDQSEGHAAVDERPPSDKLFLTLKLKKLEDGDCYVSKSDRNEVKNSFKTANQSHHIDSAAAESQSSYALRIRKKQKVSTVGDRMNEQEKMKTGGGDGNNSVKFQSVSKNAQPAASEPVPPHISTSPKNQTNLCNTCYERFRCDALDHWHMHIHMEEKLLRCDGCGQVFTKNSVLYAHIAIQDYLKHKKDNSSKGLSKSHKKKKSENKSEGADKKKVISIKTVVRLPTPSPPPPVIEKIEKGDEIEEAVAATSDKKNPLVCEYCGKVFRKKWDCQRHERIHTGDKPYACRFCGKAFSKKWDAQRHERIHTGDKPYVCKDCGKTFADGGTLNKHKRIHTGERPFSCPVCIKNFNRKWDLNRHFMAVHSSDSPPIFEKQNAVNYEQVMDVEYDEKDEPEYAFQEEPMAEENLDTEDKDPGPSHNCPVCQIMVFGTNEDLLKHMELHRKNDEKRYSCSFCEKAFLARRDLQRHVQVHTGIKPFHCDTCGKGLRDKFALTQHLRIHEGVRPFACTNCDKTFVTNEDLKRHERVHSGEKPYVCSHCGKAFGKKYDLKRHSRIHTGERPYKCTICSKAFMRTCNLQTHMNTHTGAKPYRCHICSCGFKGSGDLYRHLKSHERENPGKYDMQNYMETHFRLLPSSSKKNEYPSGRNKLDVEKIKAFRAQRVDPVSGDDVMESESENDSSDTYHDVGLNTSSMISAIVDNGSLHGDEEGGFIRDKNDGDEIDTSHCVNNGDVVRAGGKDSVLTKEEAVDVNSTGGVNVHTNSAMDSGSESLDERVNVSSSGTTRMSSSSRTVEIDVDDGVVGSKDLGRGDFVRDLDKTSTSRVHDDDVYSSSSGVGNRYFDSHHSSTEDLRDSDISALEHETKPVIGHRTDKDPYESSGNTDNRVGGKGVRLKPPPGGTNPFMKPNPFTPMHK